jgi:hypothetical protein
MSLFGRILVVIFGLLVAVIVAGITLAAGIVLPDWATMDSDPIERFIFFFVAFFATSLVVVFGLLPAALVIAVLEVLRMRSFIYYGVGGALVALASYYGSDISVQLENTTDVAPVANALQLAAAAGILGGLAYWLIAGRNAGRWRERRVPSA